MKNLFPLLLWALVPIVAASALAQTGDGYVGIYGDSLGTQACASVPPYTSTTLYVIAKTAGQSAGGITGAEFRIEVTNPSGWFISYNAPTSANIVSGNAIDTDPDPDAGGGVNLGFPECQEPDSTGQIKLGTLSVFNANGSPTNLFVKRHSRPSNAGFACPLFVECDDPYYTKVCMTASPPDSCTLGTQKTRLSVADDPIVFSASLNLDGSGGQDPGATTTPVIVMFSSRNTIQLPQGASDAAIASVTVNSTAVANVLQAHGVDAVAAAFPGFDLGDTVTVAPSGRVLPLPDYSRIYALRVPQGGNPDALVSALTGLREVAYAEKDGELGYSATCIYGGACPATIDCPTDTRFQEQWAAYNAGQAGGTCDVDADLLEAWRFFEAQGFPVGSTSTKIGIVDWGIWSAHPDLNGKVVGGDVSNRGNNNGGNGGHGVAVTAVAAAYGDNSEGIAGVNWNARILFRDTSNNDCSWPCTLFGRTAEDVREVMNLGANVINASWRTQEDDPPHSVYSATVRAAFAEAYNRNIVAVAAAGNEGLSEPGVPNYPAAHWEVISVANHDSRGRHVGDSSTGPHLDVAGPGEDIVTASDPLFNGQNYWTVSGTSLAAPHVTGIASLIYGMYPATIHNDDIRATITRTASTWPTHSNELGFGRVNAFRALRYQADEKVLLYRDFVGGSIYASSGQHGAAFVVPPPGRAPGPYLVRRHEVRRWCPFDFLRGNVAPDVWGVGYDTLGYPDEEFHGGTAYIYGMGWCEPVGAISVDGCTMRTFIYEVRDLEGEFVGWWPTSAGNVVFGLTVAEDMEFYTTDAGTDEVASTSTLRLAMANPFRPGGKLVVQLPRAGSVRVEVFTVAGQRLRTLEAGALSAGRHVLQWDGTSDHGTAVPGGIYVVRIRSEAGATTRKIALVR